MRRLFLLVLIFSASLSQAQISKSVIQDAHKVGEAKTSFYFIAEISYFLTNNDTAYQLIYNDMSSRLASVKSVPFKNVDGTLDTLYNIFKQGFNAEKGTKNRFKLGSYEIEVVTVRDLGIKYIEVYTIAGGFFRLESRRQLDKLFGKR